MDRIDPAASRGKSRSVDVLPLFPYDSLRVGQEAELKTPAEGNQHRLRGGPFAAFLLIFVSIGGCRTPPPQPLKAPELASEVNHFAGSPVSGAIAAEVDDIAIADAWGVRTTFFALERLPDIAS